MAGFVRAPDESEDSGAVPLHQADVVGGTEDDGGAGGLIKKRGFRVEDGLGILRFFEVVDAARATAIVRSGCELPRDSGGIENFGWNGDLLPVNEVAGKIDVKARFGAGRLPFLQADLAQQVEHISHFGVRGERFRERITASRRVGCNEVEC